MTRTDKEAGYSPTDTLGELVRDGVVAGTVYPQVPPVVEHDLTEWGKAMCPALVALLEWAAMRPKPPLTVKQTSLI